MNIDKHKSPIKDKKFKFNECFLHKFNMLAKAYDTELKRLKNVEKEINGVSHGICNNRYNIRYITPSDISTFVANLDRSLSASLIKPTIGDCNMFAVASVQKIMQAHDCVPFDYANTSGNQKNKLTMPKGTDLKDIEAIVGHEVFVRDVYTKAELSHRIKFIKEDMKVIEDMHFTANARSLIEKLPDIITKHSDCACPSCDIRCKQMLGIYICNFIMFALKLNLMTIREMINYAVPMSTFKAVTYKDESKAVTDSTVQHCDCPENENLNVNESAVEEDHFNEVITECYHITKPNAEIRSKIPFGIDIRTIALADNHPEYKDLKLAIEFITENPTSPFNQLLVQFADEDANGACAGEISTVMMMLFGGNRGYDCDPYNRDDVQFHSDVNWYDKMVFGNAYYDMNYRRDNPGNYTMNPITAKIDMLHKMYGVCHHENDSKTIANAIIKMKSLMMSIISKRTCEPENMLPRQATTEFLAIIGEMMSKALMKLYYLNTRVLDASDNMDATMVPGYMYEESYSITEIEDGFVTESYLIMEEETTEQKATEIKAEAVKDTGISNKTSEDLKGMEKAKHFLLSKGTSVVNFIKVIIGRFFSNWEKAQEKLLKYIEDNKKLIDEIAGKLNNGSFKITLTNYAHYEIPMDEINKMNPGGVIDEWLADGKEYNAEEFEKALYPEKIAAAIMGQPASHATGSDDKAIAAAEDATVKNRSAIVRNYILFNKEDGSMGTVDESHPLTGEDLINIRNMLIQTKTGIAPIFKKINDSLSKGATDLDNKIKTLKNISTADAQGKDGNSETQNTPATQSEVKETSDEGKKLNSMLDIVKRASSVFNLTATDALIGAPKNDKDFDAYTKSFWGRQYNILAGIIKEYKASGGSNLKATTTATTTTTTGTNNA